MSEKHSILSLFNAFRDLEACIAREARLEALLNFREQIQREPATEAQLHSAFAVVHADTPLWRGTHTLLELHARDAIRALLVPGLPNEDAQFNRGYAAALHDFQGALLQTWAATQLKVQNE